MRGLPPRQWGYSNSRTRARNSLPDNTQQLAQYLDDGNQTPVTDKLYEYEMIDFKYTDEGKPQVTVRADKVKQRSEAFVQATNADDLEEHISYEKRAAARSGRDASEATAIRRIDREMATEADAILYAAELGKVKLTPTQKERLQEVREGSYVARKAAKFKDKRAREFKEKQTARVGDRNNAGIEFLKELRFEENRGIRGGQRVSVSDAA